MEIAEFPIKTSNHSAPPKKTVIFAPQTATQIGVLGTAWLSGAAVRAGANVRRPPPITAWKKGKLTRRKWWRL